MDAAATDFDDRVGYGRACLVGHDAGDLVLAGGKSGKAQNRGQQKSHSSGSSRSNEMQAGRQSEGLCAPGLFQIAANAERTMASAIRTLLLTEPHGIEDWVFGSLAASSETRTVSEITPDPQFTTLDLLASRAGCLTLAQISETSSSLPRITWL
jgi:hypothetical protein